MLTLGGNKGDAEACYRASVNASVNACSSESNGIDEDPSVPPIQQQSSSVTCARYVGSWKSDEMDGEGERVFGDGRVYKGAFKRGEPEGKGQMVTVNGESTYEGDFIAGKRHGFGKLYTKSSGEVYEGRFKDNRAIGEGTLVRPSEHVTTTLSGLFKTVGVLDGHGEVKVKNNASGSVIYSFIGDFVEGVENGMGSAAFANGIGLSCPFENGLPTLVASGVKFVALVAGENGSGDDNGSGEDQGCSVNEKTAPISADVMCSQAFPFGFRLTVLFTKKSSEESGAAGADDDKHKVVASFESGRKFQLQLVSMGGPEPHTSSSKVIESDLGHVDGAGVVEAINVGPVFATAEGVCLMPADALVVPATTSPGKYALKLVDLSFEANDGEAEAKYSTKAVLPDDENGIYGSITVVADHDDDGNPDEKEE